MPKNVIIARKMWGGTEVWFYWNKSDTNRPVGSVGSSFLLTNIWARIYKSDQDGIDPKEPADYEWFANTVLSVGQDIGDGQELQRRCYFSDLVKYLSFNLDELVNILNTKYRTGGWPYNGGIYTGQDVQIKSTTWIVREADTAPCSKKCDLQISRINVTDNFGNFDIEVFTTTSFPSSTFSLDGTTYQASNILNVTNEGVYTVWVKDANNCIQKQTVAVSSALGVYGVRYTATIRDNDNQLWTAIIEELEYEGESETVTVSGSSGVKIKTGRSGDPKHAIIKGSELSLVLNSETNMQFLDLFTGESNKYRIRFIKGAYIPEIEKLLNEHFETNFDSWGNTGTGADWAWENHENGVAYVFFNASPKKLFQSIFLSAITYRCRIRYKYAAIAEEVLVFGAFVDSGSSVYSTSLIPDAELIADSAWRVLEFDFTLNDTKTVFRIEIIGANAAYDHAMRFDFVSLIPVNEVVFSGMIAADAYEEPYLPAPYDVDFVFYDGLGKLKELELINPQGDNYTGIKSMAQVLAIILSKTGLLLPINVAIDLFESRMDVSEGNTPLEQAYINMDAFLKSDGTPMDCYTCLELLLSPFVAQVYQRNNEWWVVESDINRNDETNRTFDYYKFNKYGEKDSTKRTVTQLVEHTAADANERFRFINASQHMTIKPAYKSITVEQTAGVQITLNRNSKFADDGAENSQEFAYWNDETGLLSSKTVQEGSNLVTQAYFEGDGYLTSFSKKFEAETVQVVAGAKGARLQVSINSRIICNTSSAACYMRFAVSLGPYWLNSVGGWQTSETAIDVAQAVNAFFKYELTTAEIQNSGLLRIYVYQAWTTVTGVDVTGVEFKEIGVSYAMLGSKINDPIKTKMENDGAFNYVPSAFKIGFGDIDHENAAYMFRNAIYVDALGAIVSQKWYNRSYIAPTTTSITNGDFSSGLTGWTQVNEGAEELWTNDAIVSGSNLVAFAASIGDGEVETAAITAPTTNTEGFIELQIDWGVLKHQNTTLTLVLYINNKAYQYTIESSASGVYTTGTITKQVYATANAEIKFKVYVDDLFISPYYAFFEIISVSIGNVTQPTEEDPTFLESLNGLQIQRIAAKKILNNYIRPMQLINGTIATKNTRLLFGNIFRDSFNLNGTDFVIVSMNWDVAMCEYGVELAEFEQTDVTDDWLLDELGNIIFDEKLKALTDEG